MVNDHKLTKGETYFLLLGSAELGYSLLLGLAFGSLLILALLFQLENFVNKGLQVHVNKTDLFLFLPFSVLL